MVDLYKCNRNILNRHRHICIHIHVHIRIHIQIHVHIHICIHIYIYTNKYILIHICIHIYIYFADGLNNRFVSVVKQMNSTTAPDKMQTITHAAVDKPRYTSTCVGGQSGNSGGTMQADEPAHGGKDLYTSIQAFTLALGLKPLRLDML